MFQVGSESYAGESLRGYKLENKISNHVYVVSKDSNNYILNVIKSNDVEGVIEAYKMMSEYDIGPKYIESWVSSSGIDVFMVTEKKDVKLWDYPYKKIKTSKSPYNKISLLLSRKLFSKLKQMHDLGYVYPMMLTEGNQCPYVACSMTYMMYMESLKYLDRYVLVNLDNEGEGIDVWLTGFERCKRVESNVAFCYSELNRFKNITVDQSELEISHLK